MPDGYEFAERRTINVKKVAKMQEETITNPRCDLTCALFSKSTCIPGKKMSKLKCCSSNSFEVSLTYS